MSNLRTSLTIKFARDYPDMSVHDILTLVNQKTKDNNKNENGKKKDPNYIAFRDNELLKYNSQPLTDLQKTRLINAKWKYAEENPKRDIKSIQYKMNETQCSEEEAILALLQSKKKKNNPQSKEISTLEQVSGNN